MKRNEITPFGKFIRKFRIDRNLILKNMADSLGVSSAFLSSVENGKRNIPKDWENKISDIYNLNEEEKTELINSIAITNNSINIDLNNVNNEKIQFVISLARRLTDLSEEDLKELEKITEEKENH